MSPKTSIILCTYNEANHIENVISELEKYIPNLELVIVDDNSSDGTAEIIKRLNVGSKFKAIFRKKNRGLASAFVRGIVDSGDTFDAETLVLHKSSKTNKIIKNRITK